MFCLIFIQRLDKVAFLNCLPMEYIYCTQATSKCYSFSVSLIIAMGAARRAELSIRIRGSDRGWEERGVTGTSVELRAGESKMVCTVHTYIGRDRRELRGKLRYSTHLYVQLQVTRHLP